MKTTSSCALLALALAASIQPARAQFTAQINGTISDSSGAMIGGAHLTLTNTGTNQKAETESNAAGLYTLQLLQPGTYTLTVQAKGFKTVTRREIRLEVAQSARIDFPLELGELTQAVEVSGSAELLDAGVSTIGQVVDNRSVTDLPTNGRNSYGFIALVPGVRAPSGFQAAQIDNVSSAFVSINGSRPNQNAFYIDGGTNTQSNFNGPTYTPSIDVVQEFKVQTNNFSAEYTNTSGGVINLVTRSGANAFHGSLYEFLRNDKLDANNFFLNRGGLGKAAYRFNQFGGTLGGPIRHNKTFFFFGYEGLRLVQGVTLTATLPTAAQKAGDFSSTLNARGQVIQIFDPLTIAPDPANPSARIRSVFPGNRIPQQRFDAVSRNLLQYIPAPNTIGDPITGNNNFASNASAPTQKNDYSMRVDHQFTERTSLFGRFSTNHTPVSTPDAWGNNDPGGPQIGTTDFHRYSAVANFNHIFSPSFLVELSSAFNRWGQTRTSPGIGFDPTQLGFPKSLVANSAIAAFPQVNIAGMTATASIGNVFGAQILGGSGLQLAINGYDRFEERANFTLVRGKHSLRFGGLFGVPRQSNLTSNLLGGSYSFTTGFTQGPNPLLASNTAGLGFASFLLGTAAGGAHPTFQVGMNVVNKYVGGYLQDDFKISPKLTLNFGLRYDYATPFTERFNHLVNFDPSGTAPLGSNTLRGGLTFAGVNGNPRGAWDSDKNNWAPRFGFAYSLNDKTVIRGGYGIFYAQLSGASFNNNAIPNTGFNCTTSMNTSADGGITPFTYLANPFPTGYCQAAGSSQGLLTGLGTGIFVSDRGKLTSYSQQWSFNIQRVLPGRLVAEAGYAGNHGVKLLGDLEWNQVPQSQLAQGAGLLRVVPNPYFGSITTGTLAAATVTQNQLLRPYPQFLNATATASTYGNAIYHSLQAKLQRRFSHGFTFLAAYTFSKILDDTQATTVGFPGGTFAGAALQNYNDRRNERALASFDTPHSLALSYLLELPVGPGKPLLSHGAASKILGGWQWNGILTLQSGTPLQIVGGNASGMLAGTQRPDWSGKDPSLDGSISQRLTHYFDTAQFTQNALFTFGNAPRLMPNLRAPGLKNLTTSLFKLVPIHESIKLQIRAEFFNITNSPQFGLPTGNINATDFGVISSQVNTPRDIQLALRLQF